MDTATCSERLDNCRARASWFATDCANRLTDTNALLVAVAHYLFLRVGDGLELGIGVPGSLCAQWRGIVGSEREGVLAVGENGRKWWVG